MTRGISRLVAFVLLIATTSMTFGQFEVSWYTIDGGGGSNSTGGTFALMGTIAQPDASSVTSPMSGGAFSLVGGFWPVAQVCYCPGDLTGDGNKDGRDIQMFVTCVLSGGNCSCADIDAANGVNLADVPIFVNNLLAGPTCP